MMVEHEEIQFKWLVIPFYDGKIKCDAFLQTEFDAI